MASKEFVMVGQELCRPRWSRYSDGGIALLLVDVDGAPYAKASVQLHGVAGVTVESDEMIVKSYSENAGMLEALVSAGLVEDTGKRIVSTHVTFPIVRILDPQVVP